LISRDIRNFPQLRRGSARKYRDERHKNDWNSRFAIVARRGHGLRAHAAAHDRALARAGHH
jgi:hypothetical protein